MRQEVSARRRKGTGYSMGYGNRHLFVSALTGKGFYSFWEEVLADLHHLYLLFGASQDEVSVFLRMVGHVLTERGYSLIYCHRPGTRLGLEGLVVFPLRSVILDGLCKELYGISPPSSLRLSEIELPRQAYSGDRLQEERQGDREAMMILEEASRLWHEICSCLRLPGDERSPLEAGCRWMVQELFEKPSSLKRFFAGSVTAGGTADFIDHLTSGCSKRYFLRGAPGTGGPVMREAAFQGLSRHWEIEAYYSFLDLCYPVALIFSEIGLAIVDGTSHFAPPSRPGDIVWELEGYLAGTWIDGMQAKLGELLKAAGSVLSRSREPASATAVSVEDADAFVFRFLRETDGCRGRLEQNLYITNGYLTNNK